MNVVVDPLPGTFSDDSLLEHFKALSEHSAVRIAPLQGPISSTWVERLPLLEPDASASRVDSARKARLSSKSKTKRTDAVSKNAGDGASKASGPTQLTNTIEPRTFEPPEAVLLQATISPHMLDRRLDGFKSIFDAPVQQTADDGDCFTEFVQLPKPTVKTKAPDMHLSHALPPMLNGLHEPPPCVARFPPITPKTASAFGTSSLEEPLPSGLQIEDQTGQAGLEDSVLSKPKLKRKRRSTKVRKKWTEEETNDLLRGVARFGIGNWKQIVMHPEYRFCGRTSIDLKDRFRVCCPDAYRSHLKSPVQESSNNNNNSSNNNSVITNATTRPPNPMNVEDLLQPSTSMTTILTPTAVAIAASTATSTPGSPKPTPKLKLKTEPKAKSKLKPKNVRSHRKDSEELARLGITGPFPKAMRRSRHAFTEDEDLNLWRGYEQYGFQWAAIQRDPTFCLGHRKSNDLRDRFRNKFPEIYRQGGFMMKSETKQPKPLANTLPSSLTLPPRIQDDRCDQAATVGGASANNVSGIDMHSNSLLRITEEGSEDDSEEYPLTYPSLLEWDDDFL